MGKGSKKQKTAFPPEIFAARDGIDHEDGSVSAFQRPESLAILGERRLVGRYVLVETLTIQGSVHMANREPGPHARHDPNRR